VPPTRHATQSNARNCGWRSDGADSLSVNVSSKSSLVEHGWSLCRELAHARKVKQAVNQYFAGLAFGVEVLLGPIIADQLCIR
jgi:hypothetical protein